RPAGTMEHVPEAAAIEPIDERKCRATVASTVPARCACPGKAPLGKQRCEGDGQRAGGSEPPAIGQHALRQVDRVDLDEAHRREAAFHSVDRQEVRNLEALVHRAAKSPDLDRRLSSGYQTRVDATPCSSRGEQVEDGSQIATLVERITEALLVDDYVEPIAGQAQP